MDQFFLDAARQLAGQWGALVVAALWALYKFGLFNVVRRALGAEEAERRRLSRDQLNLIDRLQDDIEEHRKQITDLRRWRNEDRDECQEMLRTQREECDAEMKSLRAQVELLVKGEARWRHLVGNLAQYIDSLRMKLRNSGIDVVPFDGWRRFTEEGGDLPSGFLTDTANGE
jgi:hypothetical protein